MARTTSLRPRVPMALVAPPFPLLESDDLPGDDPWALPERFQHDEGGDNDDRFASLALSRAFDD